MNALSRIFARWIPLAVASAAVIFVAVLLVQQGLRMGANDPQLQLAEDGARAMAAGTPVEAIVPAQRVDIATSLTPFVIVYDENRKPLAASGTLDGAVPAPPPGVFDVAREHHENVLTWQPRRDVRIASVTVRASGAHAGFVLAGRQLREVEERKSGIFRLGMVAIALVWGATLVATATGYALERRTA